MIEDYICICLDAANRFRNIQTDDPRIQTLCRLRGHDLRMFAKDAEEYMLLTQDLKFGEQVHE